MLGDSEQKSLGWGGEGRHFVVVQGKVLGVG